MTLAFGGIGYCIYAISLLVSVHASVGGFNIFAGALLGVCAGLLWTAQGTIMLSYPREEQKGRYFAWFWAIFNMGAVIGSLVSLLLPSGAWTFLQSFISVIWQQCLTHSRSLLVRTSMSRPTKLLAMAPILRSLFSCSLAQFWLCSSAMPPMLSDQMAPALS